MTELSPAAREPDEPDRGVATNGSRRSTKKERPLYRDSTVPAEMIADAGVITEPPTIPKDAIWKSVLGSTGGWGCERETFYREIIRDARGYRLRFGVDEPIIFGSVIDAVHGHMTRLRMERGPADITLLGFDVSEEGEGIPLTEDMLREDCQEAVATGIERARGQSLAEPWSDDDWRILRDRAGLAAEKLIGLWPNRVKARMSRGEVVEWIEEPEPPDAPAGPPIAWLDPAPGTVLVPQRKMYAPDVVGGRGISGQPDYLFVRDGAIIAWVDVKAISRAGSYPAKWMAGEAVAYDYLCTAENDGVLPEWHGYLEYRRVAKPYWALITALVEPGSIALARAYFARWARALDAHDPDALSFNPRSCAGCHYREPIPDVGHAGCPIGPAALEVAPESTEDG